MIVLFSRNESFLDIMSLVHFFFGIGIGLIIIFLFKDISKKIYFVKGLIILTIWEIFETLLRLIDNYYYILRKILDFLPNGWFSVENFVNIVGDIVTGFLGLLIIYLIFKYPQLKLRMIGKYEKSKLPS